MATTVAKVADLAPGQMGAYRADGNQIDIANVDGEFFGFDDICTHIGCSLSDGSLDGSTVTCPCHGSQFDVKTGAVVSGPARQPIKAYPVQIVGEELQV
jgi:nitrite reductase/ring-hydroxylating ferredoxin subunit